MPEQFALARASVDGEFEAPQTFRPFLRQAVVAGPSGGGPVFFEPSLTPEHGQRIAEP